jgi:hypothetical protein
LTGESFAMREIHFTAAAALLLAWHRNSPQLDQPGMGYEDVPGIAVPAIVAMPSLQQKNPVYARQNQRPIVISGP